MHINKILSNPNSNRLDNGELVYGTGRRIGNFYDSPDWSSYNPSASDLGHKYSGGLLSELSYHEANNWVNVLSGGYNFITEVTLLISNPEEDKLPKNFWKHPSENIYYWACGLGSNRQAKVQEVMEFIKNDLQPTVEKSHSVYTSFNTLKLGNRLYIINFIYRRLVSCEFFQSRWYVDLAKL